MDVSESDDSEGQLSQLPEAPHLPENFFSPKGFATSPKKHFEPVMLHFAINRENLEEASAEIERGVNLDFVVHGNTPLMLAVLRDQTEIAHLLVKSGADVTIPEMFDWRRQPIHVAAKYGHDALIQSMLEHGAQIQAVDGMLMTPLHWASAYGNIEAVNTLLHKGAHVNIRDDRGRTPLFRAVCSNHLEVVNTLRYDGASVNTQDTYGWTPLHQAALCSLPIVTDLLAFGASPNAQDFRGDTPLHLVMSRQSHNNLIILSKTDLQYYTRNLKITSTCTDGLKTFISDRDLLFSFLDHGCDIDMVNYDGKTPLELAIINGNIVFVKWLVCCGAHVTLPADSYPEGWPFVLLSNPQICDLLRQAASKKMTSLVELVRNIIRKNLRPLISENIDKLPLPPSLRQFLQIRLDV